jgi:UDP-N-acetyl-2-amino-2-deoxyglucuronate dehydrogenase
MKKFALIGLAGYIAPRHLQAIKQTRNTLVAALDPHDSVGILDSYFPEAAFFTEFERFDRHIDLLRRKNQPIDYVTICSPNYLHDSHVRFALRIGAEAICEKPLVLNPWNVTALKNVSAETGKKINTILQLRHHPQIKKLKQHLDSSPPGKTFDIELTYITARGSWYAVSWKGDQKKSGGIAANIGIHFFDMLTWIFGPVIKNSVNLYNPRRAAGYLKLHKADVKWYLSFDSTDLPVTRSPDSPRTYRSMKVDNRQIDFSTGFENLHTQSYQQILAGQGFTPDDVLPSVELTSAIRNTNPVGLNVPCHPLAEKILRKK